MGSHLKKFILATLLVCAAHASVSLAIEAPEGVVFCHGQTVVEFRFDRSNANNDVFLVSSHNVKEIKYDIYDRWGLKIASYNGITGGWNGETKNGKMAPDGVYYDILKATANNGKEINKEGFITLLSVK